MVSLSAQSRSAADADGARRRHEEVAPGVVSPADDARPAVRLLWRGDRDDRREAGRTAPHADAVASRARRWVYERHAVGGIAGGLADDDGRSGGRRPWIGADDESSAHP